MSDYGLGVEREGGVDLKVPGSGSSGDDAVASMGEARLLVDAGLGAKQICLFLEADGMSGEQLARALSSQRAVESWRTISGNFLLVEGRNVPF